MLVAPALAWRRREFWPTILVLALAWTEFAVASLGDALETARHLYLFQVFADGLVLAAFALFWSRLGPKQVETGGRNPPLGAF